jgi:hypothetical protein
MQFHGMGWDGTRNFGKSSHPMGQLKKFLSHGTIFVVPWDPTRSPAAHTRMDISAKLRLFYSKAKLRIMSLKWMLNLYQQHLFTRFFIN